MCIDSQRKDPLVDNFQGFEAEPEARLDDLFQAESSKRVGS